MAENINRKDFDLILEVNRKAIEIETERVDLESERVEQNDKIIELLKNSDRNSKDIESKIDKTFSDLDEKIDETLVSVENLETKILGIERDLFKIQVVFLSGVISLIIQIIQLFKK